MCGRHATAGNHRRRGGPRQAPDPARPGSITAKTISVGCWARVIRRRRAAEREAVITIGELGEFGLIAAITEAMSAVAGEAADALLLGPGDDAAVISAPDGRVVATTDMLIEGRHFRPQWSSPVDIGHKAAARNLADVAAMGAAPTALLVCFAGPGDLPAEWVTALATGIARECAGAGAAVAGGDISSADTVLIAITALGDLAGRAPVTRSGARPGQVVAVAGTLGSAAAGLELLAASAAAGGGESADPSASNQPRARWIRASTPVFVGGSAYPPHLAELVAAHRRPSPPYPAGPEAGALGATSMIDVSDGLIADLGHVAEASGVRIELKTSLLGAEPVARVSALRQAAGVLGKPGWLPWVLTGGDDHALVATFPASVELPPRWTRIGTVAEGRGVAVDGRIWNEQAGWEHFRS
jgi:thiamine-monophosphate kinase